MPLYRDITSADDPLLEPFRDIRERDVTGRQGQFIIEGEVVLRVAILRRPDLVQSCLIAANQLGKLKPLLELLPPDAPVACVERGLMEQIAGFPLHRGIVALGRQPVQQRLPELLGGLSGAGLIVVCIGIVNHDNIGGIFRNAAAFGADAVLLDDTCCDPLYRKALRVSVGGALRVPFTRGGAEALIDGLQQHGFACAALSPSGAKTLRQWPPPPRAALILGAEGAGLPPDILARCEALSIPMSGGFDSLNVAAASAIALHHVRSAA